MIRIKILAISGSLRPNSSNTSLLKSLENYSPETIDLTLYKGLADLPFFSPERDVEKVHEAVSEWRSLIRSSDGVIICTPEYAYGMPGVLKNALDWIVSSGELVNKPVATISASPSPMGGDKAHASLILTLTALSARIVEGAGLTVPAIMPKIDGNGNLKDEETIKLLRNLADTLIRNI